MIAALAVMIAVMLAWNVSANCSANDSGNSCSDLGVETQRQRVRSTRTQLIVARIVGILFSEEKDNLLSNTKHAEQNTMIDDEKSGEQVNGTYEETTFLNNKKNNTLKENFRLLKEDHQFAMDEMSTVLHEKQMKINDLKNILFGIRPQLHNMGEQCFELRQGCETEMEKYYNWSTKELSWMKYVSFYV